MNTHCTWLADWYLSKVCGIFNVVQNHRTIIIKYVIPWSFQNSRVVFMCNLLHMRTHMQGQYSKYLTTCMAQLPTNQMPVNNSCSLTSAYWLCTSSAYVGFFRIWVHYRTSPIDWLPTPELKWEDQIILRSLALTVKGYRDVDAE